MSGNDYRCTSKLILDTSVRDQCLALSVHFSAARGASESSPEGLAKGSRNADDRLELCALRATDLAQIEASATTPR
jgi:hypothetical protein